MIDKKAFFLMVLLMSQLSQARYSQSSDLNVERKLVQAVMSEGELNYLLNKKILLQQEDGTLTIDREAVQAVQKNGYKSGTAATASICVED